VLVALAALVSVPIDSIANSTAPLALVIEHNGLIPVAMLGVISMAAVTNGALIQIIMGSRVLYGMAGRNLAPRLLAKIHVDTRIPHLATIVVAATVLLFALALPLITLAKLTSGIVLSVFALVNLSLIIIKFREGDLGIINTVIPLTGAILCVFFIGAQWLYG
jgi:amino acid transporter